MGREIDLMKLCAARNQGGYHRCSDACPNVAHEVHKPCNAVALLSRHSDVRNQVNGNKQETEAEHLHDAQQAGGSETDRKIQMLCGVVHCGGERKPTKRDDVSRL